MVAHTVKDATPRVASATLIEAVERDGASPFMPPSGTVRTVGVMTHTMRKTSVLGLAATACMLVLTACGGGGSSSDDASAEPSAQSSGDVVDGIPEVVAEVNGEPVTREEFTLIYDAQLEQATADAEAGGQAPDEEALKEQTANNLVDATLLTQEAESRGIAATSEDVDAELMSLAESNGLGSAQEFIDALEKEGTTEEQVRGQVELQVLVEQLVADEAGLSEPTEAELRTMYAQGKKAAQQQAQAGGQAQQVPPFAEVREQLAEQAQTEQVGTVAQELVAELRKDADITINL